MDPEQPTNQKQEQLAEDGTYTTKEDVARYIRLYCTKLPLRQTAFAWHPQTACKRRPCLVQWRKPVKEEPVNDQAGNL